MNTTEAVALLKNKIKNGDRHCDYKHVTDLADRYRAYVTNEGLGKRLRQYKIRETDTAFAQRQRLTRFILKSVVSSLRKPFYKVSRNDKVNEKLGIKDATKKALVEEMQASFYGRKTSTGVSNNGGLKGFLRTRFVELSFIDPNAWVVIEWGTFGAQDVPKPYPYEVKASEAVDFEFQQGVLQWLYVQKRISYRTRSQKPNDKKPCTKNGLKYTLYADNDTVVMTECDPVYLREFPAEIPEGGEIIEFEQKAYILQTFNHKVSRVPAFRVGYHRDDVTDGRTFVAPYDSADPYLEKLIDTCSELDLTIAGHVFPQKLQFTPRCSGPSPDQTCHSGKLADGAECPECKGTGWKFHRSAQDAIVLAMPKDATPDDLIDLEKLLVYKGPPIETVQFQKDYADSLEVKTHLAMYNSTVFVKTDNKKIAETATEKELDFDSVYDTLAPYAEKVGEFWVDVTGIMTILAGVRSEDVALAYIIPGDLKMRTMTQLLAQLKTLNESQAPSFVKESVNRDIAEVMTGNDKDEMRKYDTKQRFYPFTGKTADEVTMLMASPYVPEANKVLYANFEYIFTDIEVSTPGFWLLSFKKQQPIVAQKVKELVDAMKQTTAQMMTVGGFDRDTPAGGSAEAGEGSVVDTETDTGGAPTNRVGFRLPGETENT